MLGCQDGGAKPGLLPARPLHKFPDHTIAYENGDCGWSFTCGPEGPPTYKSHLFVIGRSYATGRNRQTAYVVHLQSFRSFVHNEPA